MKPWQLGNTSVRSATRLRDGLIELAKSGREGLLRGHEGDAAWREILGEADIVQLRNDETNSVGRKWRAAMCRLGLIYDDVGQKIQNKIGKIDFITPAGHRLIKAESGPAQQECYLRALAGIWIDVVSVRHKVPGDFSPLRHVLRVLRALELKTTSSEIYAIEFALFLQTTDHRTPVKKIVSDILAFREARSRSLNKKSFEDSAVIVEARYGGEVSASTYRDYMDMNIRYLKSTGLFHAIGRGFSLVPIQSVLIDGLIKQLSPPKTIFDYWNQLTNGSILPTDNKENAEKALSFVQMEATRRGIAVKRFSQPSAEVADISRARHDIEEKLALNNEMQFYRAQREKWQEIADFLDLLTRKRIIPGSSVSIPSSERPAYFEWTLWRAFLAINNLKNLPNKARRFPVDQDMRPLGHAPGGGPDLIFEFDNYVLVVEVTLTTSIRQYATEGSPVQDHVHQVQISHPKKPVYCLFIAPELAPSTVEAFKARRFYHRDGRGEVPVELSIVPTKIEQFRELFLAMFRSGKATPEIVLGVLKKALDEAGKCDSPSKWERAIDLALKQQVSELLS